MSDTAAPPAKRSRPALWIAVAIAVVLALLIGVLATRDSAATRLVRSPLVGKTVPATKAALVDGSGSYDIDDHRGQWVLVNFFATWCVPCQQEHDDLVRFARAHAAAGDASVVSVVFSDQTADVERFFAQRGGGWPVLRDDDGALATAFGVARVPESYLVAPNGLVVGKVTGGVNFDFLQQQLARFQSNGTGG
jgi:cytochrome c biogenesis protein CcmG/thiol:disulfide interchange protein DsbE